MIRVDNEAWNEAWILTEWLKDDTISLQKGATDRRLAQDCCFTKITGTLDGGGYFCLLEVIIKPIIPTINRPN